MALFMEFQGFNNKIISIWYDNTVCFYNMTWDTLKGFVDI